MSLKKLNLHLISGSVEHLGGIMCGICGIVSYQTKASESQIRLMMDAVTHRGPDGGGLMLFDSLALGHRRLSILDLSAYANQPMRYQDRYTTVYNGEIYNYIELREELKAQGYSFATDCDTEVLLAGFAHWGEDCVQHFNGMWGFSIYDSEKQTLFCARDRFGVKPFYYTEQDEYFAFGSEIKQLLALNPNLPKANRDTLLAFLIAAQLDHSSQTMFDGILQLEPGTSLLFHLDTHQFAVSRWYDLMEVKPERHSFEQNVDVFRQTFTDAVRLRLRSDVPVGSCLSGGLDSSAIVCTINQLMRESGQPFDQHVVSACYDDPKYDERPYMDAVLEQTHATSHRVYPDVTRVLEELDHFTWQMDEPITSTSHYAQWCVYREAKKSGLTVMLDGQGADEQLAGYTEFFDLLFVELIRSFQFFRLEKEIKLFNQSRKTAFYASGTRYRIELLLRAFTPDFIKRYRRKKQIAACGPFTLEQMRSPEIQRLGDSFNIKRPRAYIYAQIFRTLAVLLHYGDRNSMAFSIESRLPFLDYRVVESLFAMPLSHKIRFGLTKRVMRAAMRGVMPDMITNRLSKLGFSTPEEEWMRENADLFRDMLEQAVSRLDPLLDATQTMGWYDEIRRTDRFRECHVIWRIISAARWAEVFHVQI
jgi:asparagine synthase (glutamine-hydrolysing)